MSRERPSRELREFVTLRAGRRCEYCQCSLDFSTEENFDIEHILPAKLGGQLVASNLALSCSGCNGAKCLGQSTFLGRVSIWWATP